MLIRVEACVENELIEASSGDFEYTDDIGSDTGDVLLFLKCPDIGIRVNMLI